MLRRAFLFLPASLVLAGAASDSKLDVNSIDRQRILKAADRYLRESPVTLTTTTSPRSAGGKHDFFSEGDYWWPDPQAPDGPYIQRDGMTNPDNFVAHRQFLLSFGRTFDALAAAYALTHDEKFAAAGVKHLHAWFVDPATRMNPSLLYSQAIKGRFTGRGIGIIDTLHLIEPARSAQLLEKAGLLKGDDLAAMKKWFADYLTWMTTHKYGLDEMNAQNNHGTCWVAQVACFAELTGDKKLSAYCADRFKTVLIPDQEAADGSFPLELKRTKPYGYSLFNLDAFAIIAQTLSLWKWQMPDGRGMARAMEYMYPYMLDKKKWPLPPALLRDISARRSSQDVWNSRSATSGRNC